MIVPTAITIGKIVPGPRANTRTTIAAAAPPEKATAALQTPGGDEPRPVAAAASARTIVVISTPLPEFKNHALLSIDGAVLSPASRNSSSCAAANATLPATM